MTNVLTSFLGPIYRVYTIQPVVKSVVQPAWQPAVSCIQTSNRLSTGRLDVRLHDTAGCSFPWRTWTPSNTWFFEPNRAHYTRRVSRSVRSFLRGSRMWLTNRPTGYATRYVTIGRIQLMLHFDLKIRHSNDGH